MRILMPVDRSEFSKSAVAFVAARAAWLGGQNHVELVNAQYPVSVRVARTVGKEMVRSYHEAEAAKALKPAAATLRRAGLDTGARHVVGQISNELAGIATSDPADLIVMGSHGETGLKHLLFGSVTHMIAASCTKPLFILRDGPAIKRESLKVAIALDGSAYGLATVQFIAQHREFFGPAPVISLLHVVPDLTRIVVPGWIDREVSTGIKPEQAEAMYAAGFDAVFKPAHDILARAGLKGTEVRLTGTQAGEVIGRHASKSRVDVLAMGSLGFGAGSHGGMGSVATRAAAHCRTALLLVRHKQPR